MSATFTKFARSGTRATLALAVLVALQAANGASAASAVTTLAEPTRLASGDMGVMAGDVLSTLEIITLTTMCVAGPTSRSGGCIFERSARCHQA